MTSQRATEISRTTRVVLVDDHPLIRKGLAKLFAEIADLELVGFAVDGETALAICRQTAPDVVLMDLRLPGIDGIETARRLLAERPSVGVVLLTSFPSIRTTERAIEAGVVACLAKDDSANMILGAIRNAVHDTGIPIPRAPGS